MWFDDSRELLGSVLRITFEHKNKESGKRLIGNCWRELERFKKKYSRFIDGNYIYRINLRIGKWQKVDAETFELLRRVDLMQRKYRLNFNLSVKEALDVLGYDKNYSFRQKGQPQAVTGVLKLKKPGTIYISHPIELGGFGKGYAIDIVLSILKKECKNICLDFGGDIYAKGKNQQGNLWKMALESPFKADEGIGTMTINGKFLAASNPLKRSWGNKKQFHHLIDVETGRPARSWAAAYVLAKTGFEADYLATALFCTPPEKIQLLAGRLKKLSFALVDKSGKITQINFPAEFF